MKVRTMKWEAVTLGFLIGGMLLVMPPTPILGTQVEVQVNNMLTAEGAADSPLTPYRNLPYYLETSSTAYGFFPNILDLNHDGFRDFVFLQFNPDYYIAMNASGQMYWVKSISSPPYFCATGDFDRDGYLDDILSYYPWSFLTSNNVIAWDESGAPILSTANDSIQYNESYSQFIQTLPNRFIGDFSQDGYYDDFILIYSAGSPQQYFCGAKNFFSKESLWNFSLGGYPIDVEFLPCDLTNNGFIDNFFVFTGTNRTYAVDHDGTLLWSIQGGGYRPGLARPITIGDLDHDGYLDDIIYISACNNSIYALNNSGHVLWNFTSTEAVMVTACDYDNDGYIDEVCVIEDQRMLVLDESGSILLEVSFEFKILRVRVEDVTCDGWVDFLIASHNLLIVNHSGDILCKRRSIYHYTDPISALDLDMDGTRDETLWCIGGQMTIYRWVPPNITVTFAEEAGRSVPIHTQEPLRVNITSLEPYMAMVLNASVNASRLNFSINPQERIQESFTFMLNETGDVTFRVTLEYHGFALDSDIITITGKRTVSVWMWMGVGASIGGVATVGAVLLWRRRSRMEAGKDLSETHQYPH